MGIKRQNNDNKNIKKSVSTRKSSAGRKSIYGEEIVSQIIEELTKHCDRKRTCKQVGITYQTFYNWMKEYDDFSYRVIEAENNYREQVHDVYREQATKAFEEALFGNTMETWRATESMLDSNGNVIGTKETERSINRGAQKWAIERVLGKPGTIEDAAKILVSEGVIPHGCAYKVSKAIEESNEQIKEILAEGFMEYHQIKQERIAQENIKNE